MAFKWHFVAFMALTLWMAGCQTPAAQETNAANSQVANTERSQPSESAPGAMEHAQPPSADEIIATEAALASENSGATKPLPAEKKSAAKSKKTVAKSETPGQKTAPKELTSPEKTKAEPPPSESKGTAAVAAAEPTENKTEGQSQPASSESKEIAAQPEPAKTETLSAKPKTEEITPSAQKSVSESPFIGTVVLSPLQKKFVVVDFRNGEVPPIRSELGVYREGIFVGSVRISEPVKPPLASADILSGALRRGDVVQ